MQSAAAPLPEAITAGGRVLLQPVFWPSCRRIDGRPLFDRPVATDQLDYIPAFGITDGIDRRIKLASASAEGKAVPVTNRPSLGQTCIAGSANGLRVLFAHAVMNCFFRCLRLKFRASVRRPDSCSRRKTVRSSEICIPKRYSGACIQWSSWYAGRGLIAVLPLIFPRSRGLSNCSISLGNVTSTSRSGLGLSKYPPENTRQVSVSISELRESHLAQSAHFIFIRVFILRCHN